MATIYMATCHYMKRQQHIGLYCKNAKYCNYNTTVALNTIILHAFVHFVHIYNLVLTFGYHTSLSMDFSRGGGPNTLTVFICRQIANYHNAPMLSLVTCGYGHNMLIDSCNKIGAPSNNR